MMRNFLKNGYKDKTVLVTGHTGFKGSWLSIWLRELGAQVIGYSLDPWTKEDNFIMSGLKDKVVDIRGDIRDVSKLREVFETYRPEFVFHLAAQPLVRLSYDYPRETYETNVMGTMNILEQIRQSDCVKVAVIVTSDKCYENKDQIWGYREEDPLGGYDPYSSSKACVEILVTSFRKSFFNPCDFDKHGKSLASVRAGNVMGGGDWSADRIIPDCIRAIMKNEEIEVRNPKAVRPWQHVLEPLYGYLLLGAKMSEDGPSFCDAWNFGPEDYGAISVEKLVEGVIAEWGEGCWSDASCSKILYETSRLILDCTKAKILLGWEPRLRVKDALALTIYWYKNYLTEDCYEICRNQIERYMDLL